MVTVQMFIGDLNSNAMPKVIPSGCHLATNSSSPSTYLFSKTMLDETLNVVKVSIFDLTSQFQKLMCVNKAEVMGPNVMIYIVC
ncbi:hypothetical protein LTR37_008945 [Vermiconidia calcicola]|uniref:Uncharacterized protein n=1 Tax=Vermiconidia calcicola TaxID=1690605 RepID=A0ACC3N9S4_9PEZI|nr:hypothetical protein LTR37_008945 [Vermiconidia calcicola]